MSPVVGDRLPANIYEYFRAKIMRTGVVSTVDEDGYPRGAPMSLFYALDDQTLLMGAQNRSQTFKNVERTGKIALTFLGGGDVAFTIRGKCRVFKTTMETSKYLGILVVEVEAVKSDVAIDVEVTDGIQYTYRSQKWEDFVNRVLDELWGYTLADVKG